MVDENENLINPEDFKALKKWVLDTYAGKKAVYDRFIPVDQRYAKDTNLLGQLEYHSAIKIDDKLYSVKLKIDLSTEIELPPAVKGFDSANHHQQAIISDVTINILTGKVKPSRIEGTTLYHQDEDFSQIEKLKGVVDQWQMISSGAEKTAPAKVDYLDLGTIQIILEDNKNSKHYFSSRIKEDQLLWAKPKNSLPADSERASSNQRKTSPNVNSGEPATSVSSDSDETSRDSGADTLPSSTDKEIKGIPNNGY